MIGDRFKTTEHGEEGTWTDTRLTMHIETGSNRTERIQTTEYEQMTTNMIPTHEQPRHAPFPPHVHTTQYSTASSSSPGAGVGVPFLCSSFPAGADFSSTSIFASPFCAASGVSARGFSSAIGASSGGATDALRSVLRRASSSATRWRSCVISSIPALRSARKLSHSFSAASLTWESQRAY